MRPTEGAQNGHIVLVAVIVAVGGGGKSSDSTSTDRTPTAILIEQNDEWVVQRARYKTLETIAPLSDDPTVSLPAVAG